MIKFWGSKALIRDSLVCNICITWIKTTVNNFLIVDRTIKDYMPPKGLSVVFSALFQLMISCSIPKLFAVESGTCLKSGPNFHVFEPQIFDWGAPNFWYNFSNYPLSNMWESLVAITQVNSVISSKKKNKWWVKTTHNFLSVEHSTQNYITA